MAALGFCPCQTRTIVSIVIILKAKDSSHRFMMGKYCGHISAFISDRIFFVLTGKEENYSLD